MYELHMNDIRMSDNKHMIVRDVRPTRSLIKQAQALFAMVISLLVR